MADILAIDTSSESCSVALTTSGETREKFEHAPLRHAELVLPWTESLLAEAGISLRQLDAIAFGRGPGSFTGLRIGIGVVQGLAWAAQLPVVPVSSLAAVAQTFYETHDAHRRQRLRVAMDARMQEVFTAGFSFGADGLATAETPERVCPPELVFEGEPLFTVAAGNGFERYAPLRELAAGLAFVDADCWPRAAAICRLATAWLERNDGLPAARAQPVYLRDNVAEKSG